MLLHNILPTVYAKCIFCLRKDVCFGETTFVLSSDGGCVLALLLPREIGPEYSLWECDKQWLSCSSLQSWLHFAMEETIRMGWMTIVQPGQCKEGHWLGYDYNPRVCCTCAAFLPGGLIEHHAHVASYQRYHPKIRRWCRLLSTLEWVCDASDSLHQSA